MCGARPCAGRAHVRGAPMCGSRPCAGRAHMTTSGFKWIRCMFSWKKVEQKVPKSSPLETGSGHMGGLAPLPSLMQRSLAAGSCLAYNALPPREKLPRPRPNTGHRGAPRSTTEHRGAPRSSAEQHRVSS
eukprot:gene13930-biopygen15627